MASILIIASTPSLWNGLRKRFVDARMVTYVASTMERAAEVYADLEDPVVVLDVDGGGLDGLSALQSLKRFSTRPKVLALCDHAARAKMLRAAGATAVLTKSGEEAADGERTLEAIRAMLAEH